MLIAIGILAHNEAEEIGNIIADLKRQSLLRRPGLDVQVHVIANGCVDDTVGVSKRCFGALAFDGPGISAHVHDLARTGKSYAWNEFIHEIANAETDLVFMIDADIRIPDEDTLEKMFNALVETPAAVVAVDRSEKDLATTGPKTFVERLILAGTGTAYDNKISIAGGLYCARYPALRSIVMPIGLPGEDGFLRAMLLTSNFKHDEDLRRLVFVESARHVFESEKTVRSVFRHNVRLAIGTAINVMLFEYIRRLAVRAPDFELAKHIAEMNERDPDWINGLIKSRMKKGEYFLVNRHFLLKRLHRFRGFSFRQRIPKIPILLIGLVFDLALYVKANRLMREGAGAGYW